MLEGVNRNIRSADYLQLAKSLILTVKFATELHMLDLKTAMTAGIDDTVKSVLAMNNWLKAP